MKPFIAAAAIRQPLEHGLVTFTGKRHHEIIRQIVELTGVPRVGGEQGFLDSSGQFHTRASAAQLALAAGQITALRYHKTQLFSEELWP